MPRSYRHMTWRARCADLDMSEDVCLQSLAPNPTDTGRLRWVTVARGNQEFIDQIAEALNRARFTLFDICPAQGANDGSGNKRDRIRRARDIPNVAMARADVKKARAKGKTRPVVKKRIR